MLMRLRVKRGISQIQLSVETGLPRSVINKIESGRVKNPMLHSAEVLAKYYNVKVDEIIKD